MYAQKQKPNKTKKQDDKVFDVSTQAFYKPYAHMTKRKEKK